MKPYGRRLCRRIIFLAIFFLLLLSAGGFFFYTARYYHADAAALGALSSNGTVQVTQTDYGWFFDGPSEEDILVFYPGGKVEETAYAPLLHELAEEGMDACLVRMPFRLAFLGLNRAAGILESMDHPHRYIGGHSLGGVAAASYAAKKAGELDGLILLASYPAQKLDGGLQVLTVRGTQDDIVDPERYMSTKKLLPETAEECLIRGGNHAQFGSYGAQKGDGEAAVSAEMQRAETIRSILLFAGCCDSGSCNVRLCGARLRGVMR